MASRRRAPRKGADPVATIARQVEEAIEAVGAHEDAAGLLGEHEASGALEKLRQDVATLAGLVAKKETGTSASGGAANKRKRQRRRSKKRSGRGGASSGKVAALDPPPSLSLIHI